MRPERVQETPLTAQGRPNGRPRRPNGSPEAPKMVENGCQNRSKIDDQFRSRLLSFFKRILGEQIGKFWCYFRCFFVCRALPNEKEALVKIVKQTLVFTKFFHSFPSRR